VTAQTEDTLHFGLVEPGPGMAGFTRPDLSSYDGSAAPVVRELIQNALDAASGQPARVRFVITSVQTSEIPGINNYRQALHRAKAYRKSRDTGKSHDEQSILRRIDDHLRGDRMPVLLCTDNGHGITPEKMTLLLTSGNTDKSDGGAGSFGVGHLTAFSASDLRYVMYGSAYSDNGQLRNVSSGHAILATGRTREGNFTSEQGYWKAPGQGQDWDAGETFPRRIPAILRSGMPERTGTLVAMLGYHDFRRESDDPSAQDQILQVAAANFLCAVHDGSLIITVEDERSGLPATVLDKESLGSTLEMIRHQKTAPIKDHISGAVAWSAYQTLLSPHSLEPISGSPVVWREARTEEREFTQVHFFRKGMWIESRWDGFRRSDFPDNVPFDAVVNMKTGDLQELVRYAEDPGHLRIERKRLLDPQKAELRALRKKLKDKLRETVPKVANRDEFSPRGFAELYGDNKRKAEKLPSLRTPSALATPQKDALGPSQQGRGGSGGTVKRAPQKGKIVEYRQTVRLDTSGQVVDMALDCNEEHGAPLRKLGVRVRLLSGSDRTCDEPEPPDWLRLTSVENTDTGERVTSSSGTGQLELEIEAVAGRGALQIRLAPDNRVRPELAHLLDIDLVGRRGRMIESHMQDSEMNSSGA